MTEPNAVTGPGEILPTPGARQPGGVRWTESDLDRCEYGRHSIDPCDGCPGGHSTGNKYLLEPDRAAVAKVHGGARVRRIGTMVRGEPIFVAVKRESR